MHAACVTTGVALLGASVMAVAPIMSMPPAIATATSTVGLAAAPKPLDFYQEVAQRTVFYAESLAQWYSSDPGSDNPRRHQQPGGRGVEHHRGGGKW
jgi:hypothetical protein